MYLCVMFFKFNWIYPVYTSSGGLVLKEKKNTSVYSAQLSESQRIKATFIDILYVCNVIETVLMHDIILKTRFTTFRSVIKIS
jgi:hypothetical protein